MAYWMKLGGDEGPRPGLTWIWIRSKTHPGFRRVRPPVEPELLLFLLFLFDSINLPLFFPLGLVFILLLIDEISRCIDDFSVVFFRHYYAFIGSTLSRLCNH